MFDQDGDNFRKLWIRSVLDRLLLLVSAFLIASFIQVPLANLMGGMGVADWLFLMPPPVRWLVVLAVASATWALAIRQGGLRFSHFLNAACFRRPPLGALALVGTLLLAWMPIRANSCDPILASAAAAMGLAVALGFSTVWEWLQNSGAKTKNEADTAGTPKKARGLEDLTDEELDEWIKNDDPIADSQQDLFETGWIADRTCRALREDGAKSVALIGPYGCGKTSVVQMLENQLSREEPDQWAFCIVSGWGYDGAIPLIEQALEDAIEAITPFIDTANLRRIPAQYRRAMQACGNGVVAALVELADRGSVSPDELLARIDQTLALANRKLVIVLEDLDRNRDKRKYWQTLLGFMDRLHQCHHLHFILNCGMRTTKGDEFVRICDHVERFPDIPRESFLSLGKRFYERWRAMLAEKEYADLTNLDNTLESHDGPRFGQWRFSYARDIIDGQGGYSHIENIRRLLSSPRLLKRWVGRTDRAWARLCGEVNLDDLILLNALRFGAPTAFTFIDKHANLLRYAKNEESGPVKFDQGHKVLLAAWEKTREVVEWDHEGVWALIRVLFPEPNANDYTSLSWTQRVLLDRETTDYLTRAVAERTSPGELRDQDVIATLKRTRREDDPSASMEIVRRMTNEPHFSAKVRQFRLFLDRDSVRDIARDVISCVLSDESQRTDWPNAAPALQDSYFLTTEHRIPDPEHRKWVVDQLTRVLPYCLELANTVYMYWRTQDPKSRGELCTPLIRADYIQLAAKLFSGKPEVLARSLMRTSAQKPYWTLHIFVRQLDDREVGGNGFDHQKWDWLPDVLLKLPGTSPHAHSLCMLNVMCLVCKVHEQRYSERGMISTFVVDEAFVDSVFSDRQGELAARIDQFEHEATDEPERSIINACQEWARRILDSLEGDAPEE